MVANWWQPTWTKQTLCSVTVRHREIVIIYAGLQRVNHLYRAREFQQQGNFVEQYDDWYTGDWWLDWPLFFVHRRWKSPVPYSIAVANVIAIEYGTGLFHLRCIIESVLYKHCIIGSRPSDHYFRSVCLSVWLSVCLSVCLFVQSFLSAVFDPIWIKLGHMLHVRV